MGPGDDGRAVERNAGGGAEGGRGERAQRWLERLNRSHHALWLLFVASFLETIIVPIPIETILIPFMLTNRDRLWRTAAVVTAGCLAASALGYGIGYFLFESIGRTVVEQLGWQQSYDSFQQLFSEHGFWAILAIGVIPIPFQIAMLVAGAASYPAWKFAIAATIARGIRYFGLAWLAHAFGDRAERLWQRHKLAAVGAVGAVILGLWGLTQWLGSTIMSG